MSLSPMQPPESRARDAMKFVRVSLDDGYLTNISISMILVELQRRGLKIVPVSSNNPEPRNDQSDRSRI